MAVFNDDVGVMNKPMKLSDQGIHQITTCLNQGSKEICDLLINECNIIYECKICQNLFRSIANFIFHKRGFCKEHCCEKMLLFENGDVPEEHNIIIVEPESPEDAMDYQSKTEDTDILTKDQNQNKLMTIAVSPTKIYNPPFFGNKKNSTAVNVIKDNKANCFESCLDEISKRVKSRPKASSLTLRNVSTTRNAVLQALYKNCDNPCDLDKGFERTCSEDNKIVNSNCELKQTDSIPKSSLLKINSDNKDRNSSKTIWEFPVTRSAKKVNKLQANLMQRQQDDNGKWSSRKSNKLKTLNKHDSSSNFLFKTHYVCPICSQSFCGHFGFHRHLSKVHNKSDREVENLFEKVRGKAFKKTVGYVESHTFKCPHCHLEFKCQQSVSAHVVRCGKRSAGVDKSTSTVKKVMVTNTNRNKIRNRKQSTKTTHIKKTVISNARIAKPKNTISKKITSDIKKKALMQHKLKSNARSFTNALKKKLKTSAQGKPNSGLTMNNFKKIEKKLNSSIDFKKLQCKICDKTLGGVASAKRHVAQTHLRCYRFSCRHCSCQFFYRCDTRAHLLRQHAKNKVTEDNVNSFIAQVRCTNQKSRSIAK